jgi:hypothetical protein
MGAKINFRNYGILIFYPLYSSCSAWEPLYSWTRSPALFVPAEQGFAMGGQSMQRCLYALFSVVIALCGVLLVAVPRFFLLPPVPVGIVAHNLYRLPSKHIGKAPADTGKRSQNVEFFEAGDPIPL